MKKHNPQNRQQSRNRRRARVRSRVSGTAVRPRLNVFRSLRGMYAQLIDDTTHATLVSVQSKKVDTSIDVGERTGKEATAFRLGVAIAKEAQTKNISEAVFDRAGYLYHGRVKALAEGAREGGLKF